MTVKQKQYLLAYHGFYTGVIDGKWGKLSKEATRAFQTAYGMTATGICDVATEAALKHAVSNGMPVIELSWDDIKYFKRSEFACKCGKYCNGYPTEIDLGMVRIADAIRERIGKPLRVNSGLRCRTHNASVGGATNSQHLYGTACDLAKPDGVTPAQMAKIAEDVMGNTGGIGIYTWGIHIDNRKTKSRWNG